MESIAADWKVHSMAGVVADSSVSMRVARKAAWMVVMMAPS